MSNAAQPQITMLLRCVSSVASASAGPNASRKPVSSRHLIRSTHPEPPTSTPGPRRYEKTLGSMDAVQSETCFALHQNFKTAAAPADSASGISGGAH